MNTEWNSETQTIHNWIQDDQYFTKSIRDLVHISYLEAKACDTFTKEQNAVITLSHMLEEFFECLLEDSNFPEAGVFADLFNHAYSNVKWHGLANWYMNNVLILTHA